MGQESEKKHRKIYLLLIMLLLVAGILLGILYFQSSQEIEKSQKEDAASSKKQEHSMKTNEKAEVNIKEMQAGDVVEDSVIAPLLAPFPFFFIQCNECKRINVFTPDTIFYQEDCYGTTA